MSSSITSRLRSTWRLPRVGLCLFDHQALVMDVDVAPPEPTHLDAPGISLHTAFWRAEMGLAAGWKRDPPWSRGIR